MILLHPESDPANAVRHRVEIHAEVVGYVIQRAGGWWIAAGPADAPLGGLASPLIHPTQMLALSYLLACTGALARLTRIEEAR